MTDELPTGERARQLVAAILEEKRESAAQPTKEYRRRRSRLPILVLLTVVLIGVTGWNVIRALSDGETFTEAEVMTEAFFSVLLAIGNIEEHFDETGELPQSLESINADTEGLFYRADGNTYELRFAAGEETISYRRGDDVAPLESRLEQLIRGGA